MNTIQKYHNLSLAKLTRNEKYLPERYSKLLNLVREKDLNTTRLLSENDPFGKKRRYKTMHGLMSLYGFYLKKLYEMGFLNRERNLNDDITKTGCGYIYESVNIKTRKINLKKYESVYINKI